MSELGHDLDKSATSFDEMKVFLRELFKHFRVLAYFFGILFVISVFYYMTAPRKFVAVAVIGAPQLSVTESLNSNPAGVASQLLGVSGANSNGQGKYQQFVQMLHSVRLAQVLAEKDNILPAMYPNKWDEKNKRWKAPTKIDDFKRSVKAALQYPASSVPDTQLLVRFLDKNLDITPIAPKGGKSLLGNSTAYYSISLRYRSPEEARKLLALILEETDALIRNDVSRDVSTRIAYLQTELPNVAVTDQRTSLISLLSSQEQMQMMLKADRRYAFNMIDPPNANRFPVSPMGPIVYLLLSFVLAILGWGGLVWLSLRNEWFAKLLYKIEGRKNF